MDEVPTFKYLKKIGYYKIYRKVYFPPSENSTDHVYGQFKGGILELPEGITGAEYINIVDKLKDEYKIYCGKSDPVKECEKRGADIP